VAAGAGRLTLVTADGGPFYPTDLLRVDADLVTAPEPAPPRPLTAAGLPPSEKAMGTEPAAWILVVLWGQALLLASLALVWARSRWGRWQAWTVGVPVLGSLGLATADQIARLLPNLL
jgi:hypothetical protein